MLTTAVTSKGQATIPKSIRDLLGVKAPGKIAFEIRRGEVLIRPAQSPAGMLAAYARPRHGRTPEHSLGRHLGALDEKTRPH